ncbi:hypothetical protein MRB53_020399 [Persea americana]|uniref:Uncharacterized protein n=1 Tax=Persea americana TaxID=3435 RepID=A0ACC2L1W6_PERAE|nr:hypothetical protein MRB53_020399 [Persea americana]
MNQSTSRTTKFSPTRSLYTPTPSLDHRQNPIFQLIFSDRGKSVVRNLWVPGAGNEEKGGICRFACVLLACIWVTRVLTCARVL